MSVSEWMTIGLMIVGYLYITVRAGGWLTGIFLRQWSKRRKSSRRQKAVDEFYEAFELDKITEGGYLRFAEKGDLIILIYRKEER
nr:DUF4752 family protein [Sodalis praecaptivus]